MKILLITFILLFTSTTLMAKRRSYKYKTSFGSCPSRTAGNMSLNVMKEFEKTHSLKNVKEMIVDKKLKSRYFISDYKISYDPIDKTLNLKFDCPKPLMKAQIYKADTNESYEAILVESGKLYDPTYEVILRSEKKLKNSLPFLALPVKKMDEKVQFQIADMMKSMSDKFRSQISEVIVGDKMELTIILSVNQHPSSVFLGQENWDKKMERLKKIVKYMEAKKKIPAVINLTNHEKVVVKFNSQK